MTYSVFEVSIINNNPKLSVTESFPPKVATYWSLSRQRISFYLSSLFLIETNIMLQALVSASAFLFKVSSRVIALCKCFNYFYTFRYTLTPLLSNHIPVIKIYSVLVLYLLYVNSVLAAILLNIPPFLTVSLFSLCYYHGMLYQA